MQYIFVPMITVNLNVWSLKTSKKQSHITIGTMFVLGVPMERMGEQIHKNPKMLKNYMDIMRYGLFSKSQILVELNFGLKNMVGPE